MSEYYGKYDKKKFVQLFVDNFICGSVSVNSFAFQMDGSIGFRRSLEKNIREFKKNPTEKTVEWIYAANIKLRANGALSDELRDKSTDEVVNGLRETITQKDSEIDRLHSENIRLVIELQKLEPTRKPVSKDFSALS